MDQNPNTKPPSKAFERGAGIAKWLQNKNFVIECSGQSKGDAFFTIYVIGHKSPYLVSSRMAEVILETNPQAVCYY